MQKERPGTCVSGQLRFSASHSRSRLLGPDSLLVREPDVACQQSGFDLHVCGHHQRLSWQLGACGGTARVHCIVSTTRAEAQAQIIMMPTQPMRVPRGKRTVVGLSS